MEKEKKYFSRVVCSFATVNKGTGTFTSDIYHYKKFTNKTLFAELEEDLRRESAKQKPIIIIDSVTITNILTFDNE